MASSPDVTVIGGGLAGCEAAWRAANSGCRVTLHEMRPIRPTAAHKTPYLAELVCSNSFRSADPQNAAGLLKEEMRRMGSLVMRCADEARLPAGSALAVDREIFAQGISRAIEDHPAIKIIRQETKSIPDDRPAVVATGPLTSDALAESLRKATRADALSFYDAISPIIDGETVDRSRVFYASRYEKGGADYLNCPMTEEEYDRFYDALMAAEKVPSKSFEEIPYFEGCMPIEVMAERGRQTLLFGPMKPVGLVDPKTGKIPFAVLQLRREDRFESCYNMVGFQTKLTWPEQKRVLRMIPGLENAEFLRYGSLHRNTFINSPLLLRPTLELKSLPGLFLAGQLVGVEGYIESAAMGILAGRNAARIASGLEPEVPPRATAVGSLIAYITESSPRSFQPMNINFGLFPPLPARVRNRALRRQDVVARAIEEIERWNARSGIS